MYYDPFANLDPDLIKPFKPAEKVEKTKGEGVCFDPSATEFHPSTKEEEVEVQWQVVAAEQGGKAVAVVVQEGAILVCTSPSFLSKCAHAGLPCVAWSAVAEGGRETREASLASDSPPPELGAATFTDSGYENGGFDTFTENSSEQSSECLLVEGGYMEGEQFAQYQGMYAETLPQGYTTSLPEAIALAPDTIVVEHFPTTEYPVAQDYPPITDYPTPGDYPVSGDYPPAADYPMVVQEQAYESWGHQDHSSPISWSAGLGLSIPAMEEFPPPYDPSVPPMSPSGQTQFINLGGATAGMASLKVVERRKEKTEEDRLAEMEDGRKREEFKKKVLYNLSGSTEEREQMKIRDSFKDQILTNLRKDQQQKEVDELKVKRAFKDKILSNMKNGTS